MIIGLHVLVNNAGANASIYLTNMNIALVKQCDDNDCFIYYSGLHLSTNTLMMPFR
jgi:hypothetical protein